MIKDEKIIQYLRNRDGIETKIELANGTSFSIWNIAWGYDIGEEFAHITSNISPRITGSSVDVFYSNEIKKINSLDPNSL